MALFMQAVSFFFLIGIFSILFIVPFLCAKAITVTLYGEMLPSSMLKCICPIYNMVYAERQFGNTFPKCGVFAFTTFLLLVGRFAVLFTMPESVIGNVATLALFVFSMILWYISNIMFTRQLLLYADVPTSGKFWLMCFIFPFGQVFMYNYGTIVMKNKVNAVDTFKE